MKGLKRFFGIPYALGTLAVGLVIGFQPPTVLAQESAEKTVDPLTLTLNDAVDIALDHNYGLRQSKLDVEQAGWQVREGYGRAMPKLMATSRYQRNLASPNPFAGSDAGGIFQTLSFLDWLSYNEDARTDNDPLTLPLSLDDFRDRQDQGLQDANITVSSSS